MAKILVFSDGTSAEFADNSTPTELVTVVKDCAEVDILRARFTEDNLIGATFDGVQVENLVPVSFKADASVGENIIVHFLNRFKSDIELIQEKQAEQEDAINFLLMNGGE